LQATKKVHAFEPSKYCSCMNPFGHPRIVRDEIRSDDNFV
jgi:hypothetical protein